MKSRPRVLLVIAVLIALTLFPSQTLLLVPPLSLFGGSAPDAGWVPRISDAIFAMPVPVAVFLLPAFGLLWRGDVPRHFHMSDRHRSIGKRLEAGDIK